MTRNNMLIFSKFIQKIESLHEAKIDDFKTQTKEINIDHDPKGKYTNPEQIIDHFHSFNPTGDINHTKWVVDKYHKGQLKQEDAPSMKDTLTDFNKYRNKLDKKNINQYKSLSDLRTALAPHKRSYFNLTDQEQKDTNEGSTLAHDSDNVKLYHVHTKEASQALGKGMPWCTSRKDNKNMFDHYNQDTNGRFYIAHLANESYPYRKLGIGIGAGEFQDENNTNISHEDLTRLVNRNPELKKIPKLQGVRVATTQDHDKHFRELALNDSENISHTNIKKETLDKSLNDKSYMVKQVAIRHPNVTKEHIDKALGDRDWFVRAAAIKNRNVTKEHINKALDDTDAEVRQTAINHPNATKEHISKALNDEDWSVRADAVAHPNATTDHLLKGMSDKDEGVRTIAQERLNKS